MRAFALESASPSSCSIRARLWVWPHALREHDEMPRLWLVLADGRVLALRLAHVPFGDDAVLAPLAAALLPDVRGLRWELQDPATFGWVQVLYAAPVVPPLDAHHAGFVLRPDFQRFVAALDGEVLGLLARLERQPHLSAITRRDGQTPHPLPRPFFASVRNYNRLVTLPAELSKRRLQALERFPALVAPIVLTAHRAPNCFGGKRHAWRDADPTVEAAIDAGHDLTGALAARYGVSRGLVRHPINSEFWVAPDPDIRRAYLSLLEDLPDNQRPTLAEFERWQVYLANYFGLIGQDEAHAPTITPGVHRGAFGRGWSFTWETAARRFGDLHPALADCRDFLEAVRRDVATRLGRRRAPSVARLAQGWLACHGLLGLLSASARWHRLRPAVGNDAVPMGLKVPAVLGEVQEGGDTARELLTPEALIEEAQVMHHCVDTYWPKCVEGDRVFALHLESGERATAHYRSILLPEVAHDTAYRLAQLRGSCNREVSARMWAWAEAVQARLNVRERKAQRLAARQARGRIEAAARQWHLSRRDPRAAIDAKSQRQVAAVLDWLGLALPARDLVLCDCIAGYAYHAGPRVQDKLRVGDALALVREPRNPHDPLAIRIDWEGLTLGYVPRERNAELAARIDAGECFTCTISAIDRDAEDWRRVEFAVMAAQA